MALIKCPECSRQVSDRSMSCPQCGHLLGKSAEPPLGDLPEAMARKPTPKTGKLLQLIGIVFFFLGFSFCGVSMEANNPDVLITAEIWMVLSYVLGTMFFAGGRFLAGRSAMLKMASVKCPECGRQVSLPKVLASKPASRTGKVLQYIGLVLFSLGVSSCVLAIGFDLQGSFWSSSVQLSSFFGLVSFVGGRFLEWWYTE